MDIIRVIMLRSMAGHPITFIQGKEYDLPAKQAKRYIEMKLAVPVTNPLQNTEKKTDQTQATAEKRTAPKRKPRSKK